MTWNYIIIMLVVFEGFELPLIIGFELDSSPFLFQALYNAVMILDIIISSRTSFYHPESGEQVRDPKKILTYYLSSVGFTLDLISAIPFYLLIKIIPYDHLKYLDLFKLVKLSRL